MKDILVAFRTLGNPNRCAFCQIKIKMFFVDGFPTAYEKIIEKSIPRSKIMWILHTCKPIKEAIK